MNRKITLLSLLISIVVWAAFSWPLPRHSFDGIPFSAHHDNRTEFMLAGDHLQLLYHFWLVGDMLAGKTPAFCNLYEYNVGDDSRHYRFDPHFYPFSVLYSVGAVIGGRAFGYNLVGLLSLWLTYLFTWLLANRYCANWKVAGLAALISIALPYRWYALMGGSPAGLAILLVPAVFLGIDLAVREDRLAGGLLAGLAILYASLSDSHVFFFSTLAVPVWCVVAFSLREEFNWKRLTDYRRLAMALSPVPCLLIVAYWLNHMMVHGAAQAAGAKSRTVEEVAIFSPRWTEVFKSVTLRGDEIHIGYVITFFVAAGMLALFLHSRPNPTAAKQRRLLAMFLCACCVVGIICLAAGTNGPFEGKLYFAVRKFVPPYKMIRQPTKIFCLMPTILAIIVALAFDALARLKEQRDWKPVLLSVMCAALFLGEYSSRLSPAVCLVQMEQNAYRRVAEDAASRHTEPRAIAIVLWPGDSAHSSVYQHYASLYRIRMVNGYSPSVNMDYYTNVFLRFESINQGYLTDAQLDELQKKRVDYVLLHEDRFPEVVSAFPVTYTLKNLLNNPRLKLLERAEQVWAFRIMKEPEEREPAGDQWNIFFPGHRWEAERCWTTNALLTVDASASRDRYVTLNARDALLETPTNNISPAPSLCYLVRMRGSGSLTAQVMLDGKVAETYPVFLQSSDWTWTSVPTPGFDGFHDINLRFSKPGGVMDIDCVLLFAGAWEWNPPVGQTISLPAQCFFHAGHIDLNKDAVFLEAERRSGAMFYGPKLPLAAGKYKMELEFSASAPDGFAVGEFIVDAPEDKRVGRVPVVVGKPASVEVVLPRNLLVNLIYSHYAACGIYLRRALITRLE